MSFLSSLWNAFTSSAEGSGIEADITNIENLGMDVLNTIYTTYIDLFGWLTGLHGYAEAPIFNQANGNIMTTPLNVIPTNTSSPTTQFTYELITVPINYNVSTSQYVYNNSANLDQNNWLISVGNPQFLIDIRPLNKLIIEIINCVTIIISAVTKLILKATDQSLIVELSNYII